MNLQGPDDTCAFGTLYSVAVFPHLTDRPLAKLVPGMSSPAL